MTTLLLILDGWGHAQPAPDNAIALAKCPNWRRISSAYPMSLIRTDGLAVGLPEGQMGNSEVGHMNLGAGRIVYQDLTRIDAAIADGSFYANPELSAAANIASANGRTLHVLGLLSPGGVHSHEDHLLALLDLASRHGAPRVAIHAFLDGRDVPPRSAAPSIAKLGAACRQYGRAHIATVGGRYFGMDRDQRWDRVERAWSAIVDADSLLTATSAAEALQAAYDRGENDEFVQPTVIAGGAPIVDGDAVVFMNFRADRARQLTAALSQPHFPGFVRRRAPVPGKLVTLTAYAEHLPVAVAFAAQSMDNTLPELLSAAGKRQLRIAETEKYAHVTFFFSGGRETPFDGEQRILVPSPKVATYDLQPEMSCPEVTDRLVAAIDSGEFDFIVCNLANPDMVGHTGILSAAILAVEAVDTALGRIEAAILRTDSQLLITADHGNLDDMWDEDAQQPNTQHSMNPVPLVLVSSQEAGLRDGALCDIAPTVLELMHMPIPTEMSGRSLLEVV